jgi:hypothetical protein
MENLQDYFETAGMGKSFFVGDGGSCGNDQDASAYDLCKEASDAIDDESVVKGVFNAVTPVLQTGICVVKENSDDLQVYYRENNLSLQSGESPVCFRHESTICPVYQDYCQRWNFVIDPLFFPDKKCGRDNMGGSDCEESCCKQQENHCRLSPLIKAFTYYARCMDDRGCANKVTCDKDYTGMGLFGETDVTYNYSVMPGIDDLCGEKYQGGSKCETKCCEDQHDHCHNGLAVGAKYTYFECMRDRGCGGEFLSCKDDGSNPGKWEGSEKKLNYEVPAGVDEKKCGTDFQGGGTCEKDCCSKQHEYCDYWEKEVRTYLDCMDLRGCYQQANFILHGVEDDGETEKQECHYMGKNFGIECLFDESCEQDQLCDTAQQGGAPCERDCCNKQHDYCWNGNDEMWGYFKCMRVRGCGDVMTCNENAYKEEYYSAREKIIKYGVPHMDKTKLCGSSYQGGPAIHPYTGRKGCEAECCERQHTYCKDNDGEVRGYFQCMIDRGCTDQANFKLHGKKADGTEGNECNYMSKNFGIECLFDESCEADQLCDTELQGGEQCEGACCSKQHDYCWKGNSATWGYFKCMRVRGCGDVMSCNTNGSKEGYYSASNKILNYDVPAKVSDKICGTYYQGGLATHPDTGRKGCEAECCEVQHTYCKSADGEIRGYIQCMIDRGCKAVSEFKLHGDKADGTEDDECNYMGKNFGIECWLDESCEADQLCDTYMQGGRQCERDCCNKQHDYCWNGNDEMWGYFKCMRVRGCGDVMTCDENAYKEGYYSTRDKTVKYGVPAGDSSKECGTTYQGGDMCEAECCERQHTYCDYWEGEVRGYLKCMDLRGCYQEANFNLHGKTEVLTEADECNYMGKNFGIECLFDESCESDQLCDTAKQGGAQCEGACCSKQHEYCWNGNNEMWGYFKCMRVRGCGDVMACNEDGSREDYYDKSSKSINYGVPEGDSSKHCGTYFQGGTLCEPECCSKQHTFCAANEGEVRGYLTCMENRGCYEQAKITMTGNKHQSKYNIDNVTNFESFCKFESEYDMNFGVPCLFECDFPCRHQKQGGQACGDECCKKQHDFCHNDIATFHKTSYFTCMRLRGCGEGQTIR